MTSSSVSSCHEDQEYEELSDSVMNLKLPSSGPFRSNLPDSFFQEIKEELIKLHPSKPRAQISLITPAAFIHDEPRNIDAALPVRIVGIKPKVSSRGHGNTNEAAGSSGHGVNTNNGSNSISLTPPNKWGTRGGDSGGGHDGDEDGNEDNSPRDLRRECGTKRQRKKKWACPAAKGDPFHNRKCLGLAFPNLAKGRQHLTCKDHYNVPSTTHLPDQVRDPNGWNEISTHIYPGQEVPSSDEDFNAILDAIQLRGAGPGKPDLLSHILRMLYSGYKDREHLLQTIAQFEAIKSGPEADITHRLEESQWDATSPGYFSTLLDFDNLSDFTSGQEIFTPTSFEFTSIQPSLVTPHLFPNPVHLLNSSQAYPLVSATPDTMGNTGASHVTLSTGPDNQHQADDERQIDLNNSPSVERHGQINIHIPNQVYPLVYDVDYGVERTTGGFEGWLREIAYPDFSFERYSVEWLNFAQNFESLEHMWQGYRYARQNYPEFNFHLGIQPRASASREGGIQFSGLLSQ
ncbi:hypothetical protein TWF694_009879 [Orbilia ellipsospora]|uniref:Uncharacterized protein n=1 Tax=Orbilia ellipsospora TaxID=2528407 RepID=A0AAV9XCY5_9PEZI